MKLATATLLAFSVLTAFQSTSSGQDYFDNAIQQLQAQNSQYERQLSNWMANAQKQDQMYVQQIRQRTGDYQTPSHILVSRYNAQLRAQNPQWAAQMDRNMANNQRNFNAQNQAMQGAFNQVNQMSMNGYYRRGAAQYRGHQNQINSINDRQYYRNPNTGQRYNLDFTHQGIQSNGYQNFYQQHGQMRQFDHNGFGDLLEEDF